MASKNFKIAHLAALLSSRTQRSAHTCAELAIKLHGIGSAVSAVTEFECNGYKTERQDAYLCKLSRNSPKEANEYSQRIQDQGSAYCTKRRAQIEKKLATIRKDTGLDIETAGLSGLLWTLGESQEYYI